MQARRLAATRRSIEGQPRSHTFPNTWLQGPRSLPADSLAHLLSRLLKRPLRQLRSTSHITDDDLQHSGPLYSNFPSFWPIKLQQTARELRPIH